MTKVSQYDEIKRELSKTKNTTATDKSGSVKLTSRYLLNNFSNRQSILNKKVDLL